MFPFGGTHHANSNRCSHQSWKAVALTLSKNIPDPPKMTGVESGAKQDSKYTPLTNKPPLFSWILNCFVHKQVPTPSFGSSRSTNSRPPHTPSVHSYYRIDQTRCLFSRPLQLCYAFSLHPCLCVFMPWMPQHSRSMTITIKYRMDCMKATSNSTTFPTDNLTRIIALLDV